VKIVLLETPGQRVLSGFLRREHGLGLMGESTACADLNLAGAARADASPSRRNYRLGLLSGTAASLAQDFLHPELILAGMVYALTGSKLLVALISIIAKAGTLGPQLWVGSRLEHRPRKRPYFIIITVLRAAALVAMISALAMVSRQGSGLMLGLFMLAYLATCALGGAGHVIFMDMAGRTLPAERIGTFFGLRHFLGGALAIGAGILVIQPVLTEVALPTNYLILAVIGGLLGVVDMSVWSMTRETDGPRAKRRGTFVESLRRGFGWLRDDRNYRAFLYLRFAFRVNYLALAFFIPYGAEQLGFNGPGGVAVLGGILVAAFKLSRVVTSVIWGRVADRRGFRAALLGGGVFFLLAPLLALSAPHLPGVFGIPIPGVEGALDLSLCVYILALVALGAGMQGNIIGGSRFLIRTAPEHRRISYVGFPNTITSPLTLLPLAGAWLAEAAGMTALFVAIVGGGVLAVFGALHMRPEGMPKAAPRAGGCRL